MLDLSDDYLIFDNKESLTHYYKADSDVNFADMTVTRWENFVTIHNCLIRQVSERNISTVRQIFERGKVVTADTISIADTIIEVAVKQLIHPIQMGDILESDTLRFAVLAVDQATLTTRLRAVCRSTARDVTLQPGDADPPPPNAPLPVVQKQIPGPQGEQGIQGEQGVQGIQGDPGVAAVDSYLLELSAGTIQDIEDSKVLAYDIAGRLETVTGTVGTKTLSYDIDGKLVSITGTGKYQSKTFTYVGDDLTEITVT